MSGLKVICKKTFTARFSRVPVISNPDMFRCDIFDLIWYSTYWVMLCKQCWGMLNSILPGGGTI